MGYSKYTRQSRKRLGETHFWKKQRGTVRSITNIYSLVGTSKGLICHGFYLNLCNKLISLSVKSVCTNFLKIKASIFVSKTSMFL